MPEDKPSTLDQLVQILEHTRGIHIDVLDGKYTSTPLRRLP